MSPRSDDLEISVEVPKFIEKPIDIESSTQLSQLPNYNSETHQVYRKFDVVSLKACFQSKRFYQYIGMLFLASQFGAYFTYAFKNIGLSVKISDKALSMASSASGLIQLLARIAFGCLYDKFGYKCIFYSIMIINALNGLLVYRYRHNEAFFVLCIELTYVVFSGIYSMLPTATYETFGPKQGPRAYAVILLGSTVCAFTSYLE